MITWTKVDSWKDLPIGNWLVKVDNQHGRRLAYHTASVRETGNQGRVCVAGGIFCFDQDRIIAYTTIPEFKE